LSSEVGKPEIIASRIDDFKAGKVGKIPLQSAITQVGFIIQPGEGHPQPADFTVEMVLFNDIVESFDFRFFVLGLWLLDAACR